MRRLEEITSAGEPIVQINRLLEQDAALCATVLDRLLNQKVLPGHILWLKKLQALAAAGQYQQALEAFSHAFEQGITDAFHVKQLTVALTGAEEVESSLAGRLVDQVADNPLCQQDTFVLALLELLVRAQAVDHAQRLLQFVESLDLPVGAAPGLLCARARLACCRQDFPACVRLYNRVAREYSGQEWEWRAIEALQHLQKELKTRVKQDKTNAQAVLAYALIHMEKGDFKRGRRIISRFLKQVKHAEEKTPFLLQLAVIYQESGRPDDARAVFQQVIESDAYSSDILRAAEWLMDMKEKPLVIEDKECKSIEHACKRWSKTLPPLEQDQARLVLARLYAFEERHKQALKLYRMLQENGRVGLPLADLLRMGELLLQKNEPMEALEVFHLIGQRDKQSPEYAKVEARIKAVKRDIKDKEKREAMGRKDREVKTFLEESFSKQKLLERLKSGLAKTHSQFVNTVEKVIRQAKGRIDEDMLENLEEAMILSDLGVGVTNKIISQLESDADKYGKRDPDALMALVKKQVLQSLDFSGSDPVDALQHVPHVIMMVGVNGVGKTTTIGKLALRHKKAGKQVLLAACDTFRAAAIEQLNIWAERVGMPLIKHKEGADPSAVAYDAVNAAKAREFDVLIIDTAGRLHTKVNLMNELQKMKRVIARQLPGAPHEILLVLDATNGQNALAQARQFKQAIAVDGIVLTKLDGTAKGGIVVAIADEMKVPIRYIGVGESLPDLQPFVAKDFVDALF